jgi:adenylylsulfate kinase
MGIRKGNTIWLTGLSGAGKTTIAKHLKKKFLTPVHWFIVDGDELRSGINQNLGFSEEDRTENIFRAAHICKMLNDKQISVIACIMSPLEEQRKMAKNIIGKRNFFLAYVKCDIDTLVKRDTKGLYAKYLKKEINNVVGFDLPYETPKNEDICVDTTSTKVSDVAFRILNKYTDTYIAKILKK